MLKDFEIKLDRNFWFFDVWNAEVNSGSDWCSEGEKELRENGTKPIFEWEWIELCFWLMVWLIFVLKFFESLLRQQANEKVHAVFQFDFVLLFRHFADLF